MRSLSFLLFACFLGCVSANIAAVPFQAMLAWYAYRMDVISSGAGKTIIAPGCKGAGPGGSCEFDELMKYLQRTGAKTKPWTGSTGVGADLGPDIHATAQALYLEGYKFDFEPEKILPGSFTGKVNTNFEGMFKIIVDRIQDLRAGLTDAKVSDSVKNALGEALGDCRQAMATIHEARLADNGQKLIDAMNDALKAKGVTWKMETDEIPMRFGDGSYEVPSSTKTLAAHKNAPQDVVNEVTDFAKNYYKDPFKAAHLVAAQVCQHLESRLFSATAC